MHPMYAPHIQGSFIPRTNFSPPKKLNIAIVLFILIINEQHFLYISIDFIMPSRTWNLYECLMEIMNNVVAPNT
ncbi:hypothetical protein GCM10025861_23980 [Methanobacterium petrolearium]|nr:hypothetical protein GCM10025861_23980 [Methanobacterium petrolearium]